MTGGAEATSVRLRNVTKRFGVSTPPALQAIDLDIGRGEIFGVIGESGAGKSTLLDLINGLTGPSSGSIVVDGTEIAQLGRRALRTVRRDVGVVFQGVHLLSNATVRKNVALPLRLARRQRRHTARIAREREAHAVEEIVSFVGLSHRIEHYPAQLSGGEQQRVALARALVGRPSLLLCDEPTSSLDTSTTGDVLQVLANARTEFGTTVVVVTHDLDVVKAICDRAALLERGVLCEVFDIATSGYRSLPSYREQVVQELQNPPTQAQAAR